MTLGTVEYAVVMPSLWLYLRQLDPGVHEWVFGAALGAFSLAQLLVSVPVGLLIDRYALKGILFVCLGISFIGQCVYVMAQSVWIVLLARAIAGISANYGTCGFTFIIRSVPEAKRSSYFAWLNILTRLGFLIGPLLNWPISSITRHTFWILHVDNLNAAGYVMMGCIVLAAGATLWFRDPPHATVVPAHASIQAEEEPTQAAGSAWHRYRRVILSRVSLTLILLRFLTVFNQLSMETLVTPLTKQYYHWGQLRNSYLYGAITVVMILSFAAVGAAAARGVLDRLIIVVGNGIEGAGIWFFFALWTDHKRSFDPPLWMFCLGTGLICLSLPAFWVSVGSLQSKIVRDQRLQGSGQAVLSAAGSVAAIVGPLWAGASLQWGGMRLTMGVIGGLWLIVSFLLALTYQRLRPAAATITTPKEGRQTDLCDSHGSDTEPLLS